MQHLETKIEKVIIPISASALSGIFAYAVSLMSAL